MTRKKRTSQMLEKAELRAAGLKAVDPTLDFGDARSVTNLTTQIEKLRTKIDAYNTALAIIDSSKTESSPGEKPGRPGGPDVDWGRIQVWQKQPRIRNGWRCPQK